MIPTEFERITPEDQKIIQRFIMRMVAEPTRRFMWEELHIAQAEYRDSLVMVQHESLRAKGCSPAERLLHDLLYGRYA